MHKLLTGIIQNLVNRLSGRINTENDNSRRPSAGSFIYESLKTLPITKPNQQAYKAFQMR